MKMAAFQFRFFFGDEWHAWSRGLGWGCSKLKDTINWGTLWMSLCKRWCCELGLPKLTPLHLMYVILAAPAEIIKASTLIPRSIGHWRIERSLSTRIEATTTVVQDNRSQFLASKFSFWHPSRARNLYLKRQLISGWGSSFFLFLRLYYRFDELFFAFLWKKIRLLPNPSCK